MFKFARVGILVSFTILCCSPAVAEQYLTGRLLIAGDDMSDSQFNEAVILILEHDKHGALGVILNRVIGSGPLSKLLSGFGIKPDVVDDTALSDTVELRHGGPVDPNRVIVVHSTDYDRGDSETLGVGIAWTRRSTVLQAAAAGRGPKQLFVFIAYTGWGSGQLEGEIERGDWLDADADATIIFDLPADDLYEAVKNTAGLSL